MDIDEVNNVNNNLSEKVNPSNGNLPKTGEEIQRKIPENTTTENELENNEDVLDPEAEGEAGGSSAKKNSTRNEEENPQGETEDVLDPEAEKEKDKKEKNDNKKEEKKDNSKNSEDTSSEPGENNTHGTGENDLGNSNTDADLSNMGNNSSTAGTSGGDLAPSGNSSSGNMLGGGSPGSTPSSMSPGATTPGGMTPTTPAAPVTPAAGGTAMGGATAGGTAAGGATAGGAAAGSAAAGGATAGSAAAGGAAAGSAAAGGAAAGSAAGGAAGGILGNPYVLLAIVIIIVIIGLLGFLFNMPGLMVGKLKAFAQDLWDGVESVFTTSANAFINDDDVVKLAQYLEDMDYNLIGYGFIRAQEVSDDKTYLELEDEGYHENSSGIYVKLNASNEEIAYSGKYYNSNGILVDNATGQEYVDDEYTKDKYGIKYWAADGEKDGESHTKGQIANLEDAYTSLLRMYLMADYRITVLRNDDEGFLEEFGQTMAKVFGGSPNAWSKGLIKLYLNDPTDGVIDFWEVEGIDSLWWDDAKIIDEGTKLSIKNGWFNRPMEFELDGWTGRYGLSLEFLLSLHLGTMAPDLVTAMVQCFDTEVQVYLDQIKNAKVLTKYKDYKVDTMEEEAEEKVSEEVTIDEMNAILEDEDYALGIADGAMIEWTNGLTLTKKKCQDLLLKTGLSSPENCIYKSVDYVVLHIQSHLGEWFSSCYNYLKDDYGVTDPLLEDFEYRLKDGSNKYYNATNSLYSLRYDQGLGVKADPNSKEVETGLSAHVYPDREKAIEEAKEYGMIDADIQEINDSKYTAGANATSNGEVKAKDGYVYRIERSIQSAEWTTYLDSENYKPVDEATFNADTEGKYEETTAYYNSYIYKIYQVGMVLDGNVQYYKDGIKDPRGNIVGQISYTAIDNNGNSLEKQVQIFYDESIGGSNDYAKFRFYDENNNIITSPSGSTALTQTADRSGVTRTFVVFSKTNVTGVSDTYKITVTNSGDNVTFSLTHNVSTRGYNNTTPLGSETHSWSLIKENTMSVMDDVLYDVLYMNFVVRDKTLEELVECGLLEKDGDKYVPVEEAGKCSTDKDLERCCTICQRYVKGVIKALAQMQDKDYSYYQPYIARVVGSWFRDTYFVIPENIDGGLSEYYGSNVPGSAYGTGGSYVKVDEEYLASSGEYWTEYEMKIDPVTNEETDVYQLYYLNPDGTTSDKTLEDWLTEEHDGKTYASQEEAEKAGFVFVKKAKLQTLQDIKDNTQKTDDDGGGRDLSKTPYMTGMAWSAYTIGDGGDSGWIKVEKGEVVNVDKVLDMVEDKGEFFYKLISVKSIEQEEDAIRTETNITVKNLFRYRQFYIYDGSVTRAEEIEKDREKVIKLIIDYWENGSDDYTQADAVDDLGNYGRYALRETYGDETLTIFTEEEDVAESWLEYQLDMYYRAGNETSMTDAEKQRFKLDELCTFGINNTYTNDEGDEVAYLDSVYYTSEGHSLDPRNRNLIATVNINKSSLDAFSILENVNTLDADYQYRDFKELIVELNYFDKEDLSEAIEEVFTWLVPTYTTPWPILGVDKQNTEYGTLVHSQDSIDFLIKVYEMLVKEEKAAQGTIEGDADEDAGEDVALGEEEESVDLSKVYYIGDSWFVALRDGKITDSPNSYFTAAVGKKAGDSEFNNIQVKSDASAIVIMLGLNGATTQDKMKTLLEDLSTRYSDKNIYVLKVFPVGRNYTVMDKDELNELIDTYNSDISEFCKTKSNLRFVDATNGLVDSEGYLSPSFESADGMHLVSYSKLYSNIKDAVINGEVAKPQTENEAILKLLQEATAYVEDDPVISPVTGKIISYGEHERINVYTQEKETVGYVKIQVMSYGIDKTDSSKSYFTKDMLSGTSLSDEDKDKAVTGLNSFYDEYKDECAGYILMIDGIDITDLKNGFTSLTDAEGNSVTYDELCQYASDPVVALYNSKEQQRREEEADAKEMAPSFISYNANYKELEGEYHAQDALGGYYVKEGAYLGKVQDATTRTYIKAEQNAGVQKENPNLSEDSELVDKDAEKTVDITLAYEKFLEDKNPNYLRLIMLDDELTTVDNVEDYFPSDEVMEELDDEKFLYWMGICIEGGHLKQVGGEYYSYAVDLNDGVGATHYFGLTHYCADTARNLGYSVTSQTWGNDQPLDMLVDVYLARIELDKAYVRQELGEDIADGYLQAFISIKHNYGNLTKRGTEYKQNGSVSESTWTTYEGTQYAEALTNRRKGEWLIITQGIYPVCYGGNMNEVEFPSEDKPFTDWCLQHGVTNIQVKTDD